MFLKLTDANTSNPVYIRRGSIIAVETPDYPDHAYTTVHLTSGEKLRVLESFEDLGIQVIGPQD
ncbi:MAG: hypothetical protein CMK09_06525 [Ponticaulis sp.]|nr:hypothetical protein [Ponticaulis sp.]